MAVQVLDAWDRASNPVSSFENVFWGELKIDAWLCALVKGQGKVPFDPAVHQRPATALEIEIVPLAEMNIANVKATQRSIIAESDEWRTISWESLKALGVANLREVVSKWVKAEAVPTGDKYESKGKVYDRTTFKFLTLFNDETACRADYLTENPVTSIPTQQAAPTPAGNGNGSNPEAAAAWQFAKVIVSNTMKGAIGKPLDEAMTAVGVALSQYPGVSKYYTVQSPEVMELMMKVVPV